MTAYRRIHQPGGTYFFTVALAARGTDLLLHHLDILRAAYCQTQRDRPFRTEAIVVLPDHLHAIWTLPEGDADYGTRWGAIKARFTRSVKARAQATGKMGCNPILRSPSKVQKGDSGLWQRRFWEHTIRDQADFDTHIRYCWMNPVKHGLVTHPTDWVPSSIHRDIRRGLVPPQWAGEITNGDFGEAALDGVSPHPVRKFIVRCAGCSQKERAAEAAQRHTNKPKTVSKSAKVPITSAYRTLPSNLIKKRMELILAMLDRSSD